LDKPTLNSLDQDSGKFHLKKMGPVSLKNVGDPVEVWEAKPDRRTAPTRRERPVRVLPEGGVDQIARESRMVDLQTRL